MRAFVNYVYQDWLDARIGPDLAVEVVHVAQYFGCPRLSALCEVILVKGLKAGDPRDPGAFHLLHVLLPHLEFTLRSLTHTHSLTLTHSKIWLTPSLTLTHSFPA